MTLRVTFGLALTYGAACGGKSVHVERSEAGGGQAGSGGSAGASTGMNLAGHPTVAGGSGASTGPSGAGGRGTGGAAPGGRGGTHTAAGAGAVAEAGRAGSATAEAGYGGAADSYSNPERDIVRMDLSVDLERSSALARLTFGPSERRGATLEAAGLRILSVTLGDVPWPFAIADGLLEIDLPAAPDETLVEIEYEFRGGPDLRGLTDSGSTFTWPYYCGNLFPCHSDPADGITFHLDVNGAEQTVIFPTEVAFEVPSYVLAWAQGGYEHLELGTTSQGTAVHAFYLSEEPNALEDTELGTKRLRDAFEWYEEHLGPYAYGATVGSVAVEWPNGNYGGMEHHPLWHVAALSMKDPLTHVHEAAHGWFGDGVRLRCWEDLVLSEGTASYLAAHVLGELGETDAESQAFRTYEGIAAAPGAFAVPAWFDGCGKVDVLDDGLYSNAMYARGALFYRSLEARIGAASVEAALRELYVKKVGEAAGVDDLLAAIEATSGYDAAACAEAWWKGATLPASNTCP